MFKVSPPFRLADEVLPASTAPVLACVRTPVPILFLTRLHHVAFFGIGMMAPRAGAFLAVFLTGSGSAGLTGSGAGSSGTRSGVGATTSAGMGWGSTRCIGTGWT